LTTDAHRICQSAFSIFNAHRLSTFSEGRYEILLGI
jgi:hypothetical protein